MTELGEGDAHTATGSHAPTLQLGATRGAHRCHGGVTAFMRLRCVVSRTMYAPFPCIYPVPNDKIARGYR